MKKILMLSFGIISFLAGTVSARAESEAACAIWLCLPGGFPSGCSAAYSEYKDRIKHGRPPLPNLSSCTTGPNGGSSSGSYQIGYEYYLPCKDGFVLEENSRGIGICKPSTVRCTAVQRYKGECSAYNAVKRTQPRFIKMWVDGQYIGQFFY